MKPILKTLERIAVAAGLLLTVLVVLELIRAFEILYELHPWAGSPAASRATARRRCGGHGAGGWS